MNLQFRSSDLRAQPFRRVKIQFATAAGVQMMGRKFPVKMQTKRHAEVLVPETNELVLFSQQEVE